ncbi:1-phosphatidylinositol phosphodiesterase [Andreprevotia sp. IGB-42]|uniref:phosphatidylinositol-specific phospholipase C domain-containing protein n=1 Tax=Andreprevotia sp. IGB-42 TaxID=2497473 RepID=UPI00135C49AE|nr:phosphatidylinositol-specific phospholipase C domain-containing protein [Andreprevotia sp. IGB-42]KAF0812708.1 1-phosphatidylinositol phosphodiesterase [Andreprevotia sp. IGB-42]
MSYTPQNWMSQPQIQQRQLHEILIPGTHDSGTEGFPAGSPSRTQYYKINEQLAGGVRFLDLRLAYNAVEGNFHVVHASDVDSSLNFDTVVKWCADFLLQNPGETILMSIKQEGAAPGGDDAFGQELTAWHRQHAAAGDWKADLWYTDDSAIPTVAQASGRIVLLRRYAAPVVRTPADIFFGGFNLAPINGAPQGRFQVSPSLISLQLGDLQTTVYCVYQDQYTFASDDKEPAIDAMLVEMAHYGSYLGAPLNQAWFFNFASTANPGPLRAAEKINPWLKEQLDFRYTLQRKIYGVLITDYAQPEEWQQIYAVNFFGT